MDGYAESDECAIDSGTDWENESLTQNLPFERIFQKTNISSSRTSKSLLTVGLENETHPEKRQTKNHDSSLYKCSSYEPMKRVDIEGSKSNVLNNQPKGALVAETVPKKTLLIFVRAFKKESQTRAPKLHGPQAPRHGEKRSRVTVAKMDGILSKTRWGRKVMTGFSSTPTIIIALAGKYWLLVMYIASPHSTQQFVKGAI